ncbi:MAG: hypothetical protein P8Z33_13800, partial [Gammaproteobacteria bacterium]
CAQHGSAVSAPKMIVVANLFIDIILFACLFWGSGRQYTAVSSSGGLPAQSGSHFEVRATVAVRPEADA